MVLSFLSDLRVFALGCEGRLGYLILKAVGTGQWCVRPNTELICSHKQFKQCFSEADISVNQHRT